MERESAASRSRPPLLTLNPPRPSEFLLVQDPIADLGSRKRRSVGTILSLVLCVLVLWIVF